MLSHEYHRPLCEKEDPEVFKNIFRQHYKPLCHYAYIILRDRAAAEKAVRQAFTDMPAGNATPGNIKAYLYNAVRHHCSHPQTPAPLYPEMHKHVGEFSAGEGALPGIKAPLQLILAALRNKFHNI